MSQYTFTTTANGAQSTVMSGFDPKNAVFFAMVFNGDLTEDPMLKAAHLTSERDLFDQIERWGIVIPECLEFAIESDVYDWNHGTGDLRLIGRKQGHLGHHEPFIQRVRPAECSKQRRGLRSHK